MRAIEKLRSEAQENGNINWDEGFLSLISFLEQTLEGSEVLTAPHLEVMKGDLARLRDFRTLNEVEGELDPDSLPYVEDDLYDRLVHFVVRFSRLHPQPIPRASNPILLVDRSGLQRSTGHVCYVAWKRLPQ
ncbi:hypothetical protein [Lysobacter sp. FW306-1B-D06B]|uniref:hypothetical protein n=1 Tax=Lysobacter sp. FW306-1B-D06B TaxID=3140250 RepID=UPI003140B3AD